MRVAPASTLEGIDDDVEVGNTGEVDSPGGPHPGQAATPELALRTTEDDEECTRDRELALRAKAPEALSIEEKMEVSQSVSQSVSARGSVVAFAWGYI